MLYPEDFDFPRHLLKAVDEVPGCTKNDVSCKAKSSQKARPKPLCCWCNNGGRHYQHIRSVGVQTFARTYNKGNTDKSDAPSFECFACGSMFSSKRYLKKHHDAKHSPEEGTNVAPTIIPAKA
ncbi:uncharacterized protein LOC135375386 isoform X2 [Ornithodoros turicata]|uniref:uncharacterized protein LOC135375386 isoform X2 n=1 Tax=Ornithodoros turicata TaxID=34597 RepID=UPI003138E1B6